MAKGAWARCPVCQNAIWWANGEVRMDRHECYPNWLEEAAEAGDEECELLNALEEIADPDPWDAPEEEDRWTT